MFLARHGQGHRFTPSTINYRANIDALKRAGVTDVIAVSACGSFREELFPGLFVLVDQFEDRTFARQTSFFGAGCVAHVPMAHPTSPLLRARVAAAAAAEGIACRNGGTYLCMEGPQFSTLAESLAYKARGLDVIGMTAATEAKLAREAELPYAAVAMVTDYDCWHEEHGPVDVASVLRVVRLQRRAGRSAAHARARGFPGRTRAVPERRRPRARRRDHDPPGRARSRADEEARGDRRARARQRLIRGRRFGARAAFAVASFIASEAKPFGGLRARLRRIPKAALA